MRFLKKVAMPALLFLVALGAVIYGLDDLWARYRGKPLVEVKVDLSYTAQDRSSQIEYTIATPKTDTTQTCLQAMLPHFGYPPCWYLLRRTIPPEQNP